MARHLSDESCRSTFDERHARCEAESVDVSSCVDVVESVEHDVELLEELDAKLGLFDVRVVRCDGALISPRGW